MEKLVEEFMNSNLLILCEMSDEDCPIKRENHEFFNFDDIDDFDIIKLEDDEGHEFIPVFTDWDELDELEVPGCAVLATPKIVLRSMKPSWLTCLIRYPGLR